jgi:CubicO group peptidase (beta-lactamase class C family)
MNITAPEQVGISTERLARIRPVLERYVAEQKFAGFVTMIARRGKLVHFDCVGMSDTASSQPMQPDTLFRIYSMTKPIVSVAMMMLYEEGRFHLDDPISKFIPDFKNVKVYVRPGITGAELATPQPAVTFHHLLTHTAGLSYGWFEDTPVEELYRKAEVLHGDNTLEEFIQRLTKIPLLYQPGSAWRYSVAVDVLGYLVQVVSGKPLADFLDERIFKPLGMVDTSFYVPPSKLNRFSAVYGPAENGGIKIIDAPATSDYLKPERFPSGGGGLVSTAPDYLRFTQMLLNRGELDGARLLSPKTVELMSMNHIPAANLPLRIGESVINGYGFGLGFSVAMNLAQAGIIGSAGAFGWGGAANTEFWVDPHEKLIGILMTQFMPSGTYPVINDFRVLTYQSLVD